MCSGRNRIQRGYNLREVIDHVDELRFASQSEKHEFSYLYVAKINPPFGGKERKEVQQNFPIRTGETFLFLQHFIKVLKAGGRAGILRRKLLEECNLHTVLDCPGGTFQGAGVKTRRTLGDLT